MKTILIVTLMILFMLGCGKSQSTGTSSVSANDNKGSAFVFICLLILAGITCYCFISEREKLRDSIARQKKQLDELSSHLEIHCQRIKEQGNLITSLEVTEKRPPANDDRDKHEGWKKIKNGMTEEEINNIIGPPNATFKTHEGYIYLYGTNEIGGQISFADGKVASYIKPGVDRKVTQYEVCPPTQEYKEYLKNASKDSEITDPEADLWDTIEKGMIQEEVIKIVGKPHRIEPLGDKDELWWFGPPYSNRQVKFSDGKVVGFEKNLRVKQEWDVT